MKYLMVLQHGAMDELLYKDILEQDNVSEFKVSAPDCSPLLYKIRRVHTSTVATKYFEPPFKSIWYRKDLLKAVDDDTCVVFQMAAMIHVGMSTLRSIRKKRPGSKMVLLLVDSLEAHSYSMKYAKRFIFGFDWDMVLSFDKGDCEKHGFTYMGFSYYSKIDVQPADITSDLYYIGAVKDEDSRIPLVSAIYEKCSSESAKCDFTILGQPQTSFAEGIRRIDTGIPYADVVQNLMTSNCILELVQPGQNNQTARYMEAVCYNKKLLTNNKNIDRLPYYNPSFMKIFDTVEDIDTEWVINKETVDYGYDGGFSPVNILRIIEKKYTER